jgi:hypothetical protein
MDHQSQHVLLARQCEQLGPDRDLGLEIERTARQRGDPVGAVRRLDLGDRHFEPCLRRGEDPLVGHFVLVDEDRAQRFVPVDEVLQCGGEGRPVEPPVSRNTAGML